MSEFFEERNREEPFEEEQSLEKEQGLESFIDEEAQYLEDLKSKQDDFLDVYSEYLKVQGELTKSILKRKALELEILDPTFEFELE